MGQGGDSRVFPRSRKQDTFWEIVGDLRFRLDDGRRGDIPPHEPEFDHGGETSVTPVWATHVIAFVLGGLVWGALLVAPPALAVLALAGLVTFVAVAYRRRWR